MLATAAFIPLLNAAAKYLTPNYPVIEVVWARYAGHFIYMFLFFVPRLGTRLLVTSHPWMQLFRSALLCISTVIFMSGLPYVPLTTATAISFTGPFIVTALAPVILGERVGTVRWMSVIVGFVGAIIIVRPGAEGMEPAALLFFASAFASALYQIMSRKIASFDRAETSITYIAMVGFLLMSIPLPFIWVTPVSWWDALVFISLGFFGGFGHFFLVRAYEIAPAPFVAPFNYLNLIGAAILSVAVWGQFPDIFVWTGAGIIAACGLFMLYYENNQRKKAAKRLNQ
nr:DMT family transporter [Variibacter gotjawalensis]